MIDTQEVELTSVDDRDCHKNTRSTSDCTREVSGDGEEAKDNTAESSRSGNDPLEFLTEAVSFLEEFVEEDNDKGSDNKLNDEEEKDTSTEVLGLAIQSSQDIDRRLAESDDEGKNYEEDLSVKVE